MSLTDVPSEFLCPITYDVMTDPVIMSDGHTYERSEITRWLATHNTSPLSNQRIALADAAPNFALRAAIDRWLAAQPAQPADAAAAPKAITRTFKARTDGNRIFVECNESDPLEVITILVDDVSGSMNSASARPDSGSAKEGSLFSRLDLVKHANKTIAHLYAERGGYLGIVTFSDAAAVKLPVRKMDATGLTEAVRVIDGLRTEGCTNIWAGLKKAFEQVVAIGKKHPNAHINIVFLTDGEPSAEYLPVRGLVPTFENALRGLKVPVTVHCFGFGYSLDTKLLESLSKRGGGIYGYLPDCSLVGSVSINAAAAALSTVATNVLIDGCAFVGALQAGCVRSVQLPGKRVGDAVRVEWANGGACDVVLEAATDLERDNAAASAMVRALVEDIASSGAWSADAVGRVEALLDELGDEDGENPFMQALKQDIKHTDAHKGQLQKAVKDPDWFRTWGLNHLVSYSRALALEQCVNFKDQAIQHFAGDLFRSIQDKGNDIFDNLEPPKPSCAGWTDVGAGAGGTITMGALNNAGGGCWAGWCNVLMESEGWKPTHKIKKGDIVRGGHRVLCVVRTALDKPAPMIHLDRLSITPWHPVCKSSGMTPVNWVFPHEVVMAVPKVEFNHYVYNLVLESGHYVTIGTHEVCTLAHYFENNDVIRHAYYGTNKVIRDLKQMDGWEKGLVTIFPGQVIRDDGCDVIRILPQIH